MPIAPQRTYAETPLLGADDFRHALAHFASGVAIVTTMEPDGTPQGLTINSFSSLSLDPPLVLFGLRNASRLHEVFSRARGFAVNVLGADQHALMRRFAGPGDRFSGIAYDQGFDAAPLLSGVILQLECEVHSIQPGGDHAIVIGAARKARCFPGAPLLYWRGATFPETAGA